MTMETTTQEKTFEVTHTERGHAQVTMQGTCTGPVTVKDVEEKFYHSYFGGSGAWVKDGRWGCTRYID